MKRITIGRGRECDIRLEDSTDMVSRRQAIITFSPLGKMEIFDTSSNGTFVNGVKVEKPAGVIIRRGDQVNFAHVVDLDWSKVRDPYRFAKTIIGIIASTLIIITILYFALADTIEKAFNKETQIEDQPTAIESPKADTLKLQIPEETSVSESKISSNSSKKVNKSTDKNSDTNINPGGENKNQEQESLPDHKPIDPLLEKEINNAK